MTEKDKELIEKAKKLPSMDWGLAEMYAKRADTLEAKHELKNIATRLFRNEEAACGCGL